MRPVLLAATFALALLPSAAARSQGALPDLTIDTARLASSLKSQWKSFKPGSCAHVEGCIGGTGKRRVMAFDVGTPNIGAADLYLGDPATAPGLFSWSPCHKHYHFEGYATYELLDASGAIVVSGHKQAFCLMDSGPYLPGAVCTGYTCSNQGISAGCQDVYGSYLDCQWIDITNVAYGDYLLRVTINPYAILAEADYSNNVALVAVKITKTAVKVVP